MGSVQPPSSPSTPSTPPNDPLHSLQPASIDNPAFRRRQSDERVLNPSAPSQGTSMSPEVFQRNRSPEIATFSKHSSSDLPNIPHTNTNHHPLPLGNPSQLIQSQPLGILQQAYGGQHPNPSTNSLNDWKQSTSLPHNSPGPLPQSRELINRNLSPPPSPSSFRPHASSLSSLQRGQEPLITSVTHPNSTDLPPGTILAVPADNLDANAILIIPDNPQSHNHQNKRTAINQYTSLPSSLPPPHTSPPDFQRVLSPDPHYISPPSTPLSLRSSCSPSVPPTRHDVVVNLSANSPNDYSAIAVSSRSIQPSSVNCFEEDVRKDLETQPSVESIAYGGLDGGAEEICVPETQNSEPAAVPQQIDVDTNHEPMNPDEAAVPVPQAPLPLTAALVETNPINDTTT